MSGAVPQDPFTVRTSEVSEFERCNRRWYFKSVLGEQIEHSSALSFGTAVHKIVELWLSKTITDPRPHMRNARGEFFVLNNGQEIVLSPKTLDDAIRVARKGLHLLPAPGEGLVIEQPFERKLSNGVRFTSGGIDLANTRSFADKALEDAPLTPNWNDPNTIALFDHKTCARPGTAKSVEALRDDVQCTSYAHYLSWLWGLDEVSARWAYYPKDNSPAFTRDLVFTRAELDERWARTVDSTTTMQTLAEQRPHWNQVAPNESACDDYRGCPFAERCWAAKEKETTMAGMSLLEKIRNKMPIAPSPAELVKAAEPEMATVTASAAIAGLATGVNPPDAAPPTFEPASAEEPKKRGRRTKAEIAAAQAAELPEALAVMGAQLVPETAELVAKAEAMVATVTAVTDPAFGQAVVGDFSTPRVTAPVVTASSTSPVASGDLVLHIDCDAPGDVMLDAILLPIQREVAAARGVEDYKDVEYGKGPGALRVAFEQWLITASLTTPISVCTRSVPGEVLQVLLAHADRKNIVRGRA